MFDLKVLSLMTTLGVEVKNWKECEVIGPITRMQMLHIGVYAFVSAYESNTVFIVDVLFKEEMGEYILSHELGHIMCRRDKNDPLTMLYEESFKNSNLMSNPDFRARVEALKQEEEFKVDMFAVYAMHDHLSIIPNALESTSIAIRVEMFKHVLGANKVAELDEVARKMVRELVY